MVAFARPTARRPAEWVLVAAAGCAALALVVVPLVRLAWAVVEDGGASIHRVLTAPGFAVAVAHTLELAVVVPLFAVPLGTGIALLLRRPELPLRRTLRMLVLLPLVVPQFVLGYSWTQAYGRAGFVDDLLGVHWAGLLGPHGIAVVLIVDAVPLCYLLSTVGLATRAQPQLEAAARAGGAGGWATLRTVTLPLLRPVLVAEAILVFVATMESFAAPQVLGTPVGYATVTTRLYSDLAFGSDPNSFTDAVTLALGLALVAAVLLVPADLALAPHLRAQRTTRTGNAVARGGPRRTAVATASPVALLLAYTGLVVALPTAALVLASLTRAIGLAPTPGNWTIDNYRAALNEPTRDALWHSVQLAVVAAVLLTVLGAVVTSLERRSSGRLLGTMAVLSFAVPGSALAVGLLIAYDRQLGGTLLLIMLAYLAKFWALAHRTISGAADRMPPGEWQAARVSGAGPLVAVRTVWLPALAPALAGAWVLVFVASMHEVTMSSLLYSTGTETFSVAVLNSQELGDTATTAALSVLLSAVLLAVAGPGWLLLRLATRRRAPSAGTPAGAPASPPAVLAVSR
ncbi:MAG: iron(III) transport system permease protein [Pseudonocardiales bacterium]|nr:iron(III) transport system permease protein [Pseudonocardiales bacterium]